MTMLTGADAKRFRKILFGVPGPLQLVCSAVCGFIGLGLLLGVLYFAGTVDPSSADVLVGVGILIFPAMPFLANRHHRFALLSAGLLAMLPYIIMVAQRFGAFSWYVLTPTIAAAAGLILGLAPFKRSDAAA